MDIDTSTLSDTGRKVYEAADTALQQEVGRRLPASLTADDARMAAFIAVLAVDQVVREFLDERVAKQIAEGPRDAVAEDLFDAVHEHCEDVCGGGGRPWYDAPATRLTDPYSAVSAIAVEQELIRDEIGYLAAEVDEDGWVPALRSGLAAVTTAADGGDHAELRRRVVELAAWAACWVEVLDQRGNKDPQTPNPASTQEETHG